MDAVEFIEKYREICNHYNNCFGCPLFFSGCLNIEEETANAEQIIQIVNDWEDKHRVIKTNGDKVLSVIPASIREEGKRRYDKYEKIKPNITYGNYTPIESFVGFFVPTEWWNAELEDNE